MVSFSFFSCFLFLLRVLTYFFLRLIIENGKGERKGKQGAGEREDKGKGRGKGKEIKGEGKKRGREEKGKERRKEKEKGRKGAKARRGLGQYNLIAYQ